MTITEPETVRESTRRLPTFDGVLFFPVTPFDADGQIAEDVLIQHVLTGVANAAGGVFIACGTGEFHALSLVEYASVVSCGVSAAAGRVPVIAGVGGPVGHAQACMKAAESMGVDGFLVMPPYLVSGPDEGTALYFESLAAATNLPIIAYHRGSARLTLPLMERLCNIPNLAGIKDGVGDVALMQQFVAAAKRGGREDIQFFNGLLTAEASQTAYRAIGVPLYSSAVFAMAPEIATAFYRAYTTRDVVTQERLLDEFYTPLIRLRDSTPGFAVSLVKAGLRVSGHNVGSVRPPLTDPNAEQLDQLSKLLQRGRELAAS